MITQDGDIQNQSIATPRLNGPTGLSSEEKKNMNYKIKKPKLIVNHTIHPPLFSLRMEYKADYQHNSTLNYFFLVWHIQ